MTTRKSVLKFLIILIVVALAYVGINRWVQSNRSVPVTQGIAASSGEMGIDPVSVDTFMTDNLKKTGLPGAAIGIVRNGKVVYTAAYGKGSDGRTLTADTQMYVGSVSKSLTALAVMQLVDQGKIDLDRPVQAYLPDLVMRDKRFEEITVKELLNQSSGLADRGFPEMSLSQPHTLDDEMKRLQSARLVADPGTQWNYHNPNYHILAELVEKMSEEPFGQYLSKHIFRPLGMNNTTSMSFAGEDGVVPKGHTMAYGIPVPLRALPHFVEGSGGVISTASDMARWIEFQLNGEGPSGEPPLVTPSSLESMWVPSGPDHDYAFGWEQDQLPDGSIRIEHGGTLFTYSANAAFYPNAGDGFVVLLNSTSAIGAEQLSFFNGLDAIVRHQAPKAGTPTNLIADTLLGCLTITAVFLSIRGVRRAKVWAERMSTRGKIIPFVRNLPYVLLILLGVFLLQLFGFLLGGRDITWTGALYGWPALVLCLAAAALGSAALLITRTLAIIGVFKSLQIRERA
ncbi:serine hydrolase domain-containing protein [Paenibacillus lautus]|uniref:serine hydrolase domain-containing protein n=1 Tax=Paenibacillus lautus TaxID=1401 RepID=UPI003D9AA383